MCSTCTAKLYQLDQRVPHFIDYLHAVREGKMFAQAREADPEKAREALAEYRALCRKIHGPKARD